MSMDELGETFDIHAGGVDLVFPHHEDEIAQSEGATGKEFVRYWLHGEFLLLEGDKMAKSTGNIFNLQDLIDRGVKPSSIRYLFLTAHYRSKLNFTFGGLEASAEAVRRIRGTRERLRAHPDARDPRPGDEPVLHETVDAVLSRFTDAMDADLNTSVALSELHALAGAVNQRLEALGTDPISTAEKHAALDAFERIDSVFGFLAVADAESTVDEGLATWVEERIAARQAARKAKDFATADAIRGELTERGVVVEDTAQGPRWSLAG
jgi:cysteinyl-tRNA synthetase